MIGAFLEDYNTNNQDHYWFDRSLIAGANWLANNNPYLGEYRRVLGRNVHEYRSAFPIATHLEEDHESVPEFRRGDIVVPPSEFSA
jgi:hypothetical protein